MKKVFVIVIMGVFSISIGFVPEVFAQKKLFTVGIRSGQFHPTSSQIQGTEQVAYNAGGSPTSVTVSGFGDGADIGIYGKYLFADNLGLMFETGVIILKRKISMALAPSGDIDRYENTLTAFPITVSLVHDIPLADSTIVPYLGFGAGIYISKWEEKDSPAAGSRTWKKGTATPVGMHFLAGFNFPAYRGVLFDCEFRYRQINGNWKIKNVDTNIVDEFRDLNTGGISIRLGLSYKF